MRKLLVLTLLVTTLPTQLMAQTVPTAPDGALTGVWRTEDGSATVQITECAVNSGKKKGYCGTVIEEVLKPGEVSSLGQTVVRDMVPTGKQSWKGKFIGDGQPISATAKQPSADKLSFRICAFAFLCDTLRLNRVSGAQTMGNATK
jgi:uncharacterized protein (DUF2147 family)